MGLFMKKLRLATVFSGIGAIEHALDRMNLPHEIVFASDNGDVDIFSKKIDAKPEAIESAVIEIGKIICEEDPSDERDDYQKALEGIKKRFSNVLSKKLPEKVVDEIRNLTSLFLEGALSSDSLSREKTKVLKSERGRLSICSWLELLQIALNVDRTSRNVPSMNIPDDRLSSILDKVKAKHLVHELNDVRERLGMLYGSIMQWNVKKKISRIDSFDDRKKFVDALYKSHEKSNKVKKSYMANYELPERHFHWNVSFIDGMEYRGKVDLFVGGSPCQSFSAVGKRRGLEDARGTLFYEYARLVKEIQPKVFIYENVRAILTNDEGNTWQTISSIFTSLGYNWSYQVLNARNYGVPQNRERVFVVGVRKDIAKDKNFVFPSPVPLECTMKDFLLDKVEDSYFLPEKGIRFVTDEKNLKKAYTQIDGDIALCQTKNQQFNWHGDFVSFKCNEYEKYYLSDKVRKYVMSSGTKGFSTKPAIDLEVARPLLNTMHKMHRAGVDNYVTTNGRIRKLTPRECLRLMGFSDSFKIVVSDTSMYQQAGNSIVVDILIALVKNILDCYPEVMNV